MPVYVRKNASFTTPKEEDCVEDDPTDFLQNPDLYRDELPQPYRMLNKVLWQLFDSAWDEISCRESERVIEASKYRPPQYQCSEVIQDHGLVTSLSATPDGRYIIIGHTNGLVAIDAETQDVIDQWQDDKMHITSQHITSFNAEAYLISTIDDMGLCRLFALSGQQFFLVHSFMDQDSGSNILIRSCEVSLEAGYLGLYVEKPSSKENWLDVHKLPKEAWSKELEALMPKVKETVETDRTATPSSMSEGASVANAVSPTPTENTMTATDDNDQNAQAPQKADRLQHKFSAPSLLLKVRAPSPLTGMTFNSVASVAKAVDSTGDVIGSGASHLMTTPHLEQRNMLFNQLQSQLKDYAVEEEKSQIIRPTVHFINASRLLPPAVDHTDQTSGVAVWWTNDTKVSLYSLVKQHKDVEHKADVVMPLSGPLAASALSRDSSLLALALVNGDCVLWDMYFGTPRGVLHVSDQGQINKLEFVDPSACQQNVQPYPPYARTVDSYLMISIDNGQLFLTKTSSFSADNMEAKHLILEDQTWIPSFIQSVKGSPKLFVTCRHNGRIFIHELTQDKPLCEVKLPDEYHVASPWEPLIAVGANGGMMYLKGSLKQPVRPNSVEPSGSENEEDTLHLEAVSAPEERLFVFTLRSFPSLDAYRGQQGETLPYMVHSTAERRIECLLKHRIAEQSVRKGRMQQRWGQLKGELEQLKSRRQAKQNAHSVTNIQSVFDTWLQKSTKPGRIHTSDWW